MEIEWCSSEQQLAEALTKSMVAWRLINVLKTADINAMHEAAKKPKTPWTHRRHKFIRPAVKANTPVYMGFQMGRLDRCQDERGGCV